MPEPPSECLIDALFAELPDLTGSAVAEHASYLLGGWVRLSRIALEPSACSPDAPDYPSDGSSVLACVVAGYECAGSAAWCDVEPSAGAASSPEWLYLGSIGVSAMRDVYVVASAASEPDGDVVS